MVYKIGWGQLQEVQGDISTKLQWNNLQLDIVGFLAILGEGAVEATSQVATLSKMTFIPRLLPAPQALLRPNRPEDLKVVAGNSTGVGNGNHRAYINFLGHILARADSLPEYSVKLIHIRRKDSNGQVKARYLGPTWWVALIGFILSCTLFGLSLWQHDGMAMLAVLSLSLLSSLVGVANKWTLKLPKRKVGSGHWTPEGDLVLRYPKGNFVVVKCNEDVARELFFAPEVIEYLVASPWQYRLVALVGSILLMFGVIFLGNATTNLQVGFAVSFMVLNAAYWVIGALPQRYHWDTRAFEVIPEAFEEPDTTASPPTSNLDDEKSPCEEGQREKTTSSPRRGTKPYISYNETFTIALWKVIVATRDIRWIDQSDAAPRTKAWDRWQEEALQIAGDAPRPVKKMSHCGKREINYYRVPEWDAQQAWRDCLDQYKLEELEKMDMKTAPVREEEQTGPGAFV